MTRILLLVIVLWTSAELHAQLPSTELFILDYELEGDTLYFDNPVELSGFNNPGYNNQPSFFDENNLYITSNKYDRLKTDIIRLDLSGEQYYQITETVESEFSPTLSPDPRFFSAVRIERDGSDQSLWLYPMDRSNYGRRLLESLDNVGYHCWLSEDEVALFLVESPIKLAIGNVRTGEVSKIAENIGRCIRLTSNGELIIVSKTSDADWYLKSYDLLTKRFKILGKTLPGSEDFEVLADDSIIMASGSKLYRFKVSGNDTRWDEMDDFSDLGITSITRLALSATKLVLVTNP